VKNFESWLALEKVIE